jgi:hypothetical protein
MKITIEQPTVVNVYPIETVGQTRCSHTTKGAGQCRRKARFNVFNGDGRTSMSRLCAYPCTSHLPAAIQTAWKENKKNFPEGVVKKEM